MRLTGIQVAQGEMMPRWYGLAYYEPHKDSQVVYPIPFNLIVRWARDFLWLIKRGKKGALAKAYEEGYRAGLGEYRDAVETINRWARKS